MRTLVQATAVASAAAVGYAGIIERNWFALRRFEIPVLPPGAGPLRVLHISDAHLTPGRRRLRSWIRALDDLEPDLVVNTGDSIAHPQAVRTSWTRWGPLPTGPGVVLGPNDLYAPEPFNPARYLLGPSSARARRRNPICPGRSSGRHDRGRWLDLNNQRGQLTAGGLGTRWPGSMTRTSSAIVMRRWRGPCTRRRTSGSASHSPTTATRSVRADGYDLLLAGHTHGGQLRLPWTAPW